MIRSTSGLKSPIWSAGRVAVATRAERSVADVALVLLVDATWLAGIEVRLRTVSGVGRSCASPGVACKRGADSLSGVNASIMPRFLFVASFPWALARARL